MWLSLSKPHIYVSDKMYQIASMQEI